MCRCEGYGFQAVYSRKGSRVPAAHPHPEIPKVPKYPPHPPALILCYQEMDDKYIPSSRPWLTL